MNESYFIERLQHIKVGAGAGEGKLIVTAKARLFQENPSLYFLYEEFQPLALQEVALAYCKNRGR